ncbi:LacI family DNA-binding transcriptional regulator [Actinocatenispora rupis]|uniref:LacI family transcriptional regulator n=1 Tax=Actinocatenispora rupis TaxID=519421 RepID=A0A8J3J4U3_9ACTN|nr:LacI family DNA-binding transcriptional regulator [Actinocatenispora rupis]GID15806.1 LacI family transcriptional regulator [Actinocatenispora rupis]
MRLSDVAAVAGVSIATASKALNGSTRISRATRDRVHEAAQRLDFRPDALARSFASGQSGTIGVLTHRAKNTFARSVTIGAVLQLGEQNQAALVYDGDVTESRAMATSVRELQARRIDGLLVIGDGHEHASPSLTHHFDVPVTYVFTASSDPTDVMYLPDNQRAGRMATQHLIDTGHTRIAHLTGPRTSIAAQRRKAGMREALEAAGLDLVGRVRHGDWTRVRGARLMAELLASGAEFDAVFCGNDHIALGAIETCAAAGVRVPEDVALVGVDNWEGIVVDQRGADQLTSVDLELMELGRRGAASLLSPEHAPGEHYVTPTLVVGPSSRR